ncbi:hypothetical protein D9M71_790040 [compost metagenome]
MHWLEGDIGTGHTFTQFTPFLGRVDAQGEKALVFLGAGAGEILGGNFAHRDQVADGAAFRVDDFNGAGDGGDFTGEVNGAGAGECRGPGQSQG